MKKIITILMIAFGSHLYSQSLVPTGDLTNARWKHQAQLLNDGNVLIFGGDNAVFADPVYYNSCELYNSVAGVWSSTGNMNAPRNNFASAVLSDGKVLAIGGRTTGGDFLSTCEVYDPGTETWSYVAEMSSTRWGHKAVTLLDGRILVVGGGDEWAEIYDPADDTWTLTEETSYDHGQYSSLVLLDDGRVLSTGGWFADPDGFIAEIYDPVADEWTAADNMGFDRQSHSSVLLEDGKVLVYGSTVSNSAEIYDPISNTFTETGSTQNLRSSSEGIRLSDGRVLVYGRGDLFSPGDTKELEIYNPVTGEWTAPSTSSFGASSYSILALNSGEILIAGGNYNTGSGASGFCWLVNGVGAAGLDQNQLNSKLNLDLYPNPSTNEITIQIAGIELGEEEVTLEIINSSGLILKSFKINSVSNLIDISNLSEGFYFVRVSGENKTPMEKTFVKI